MGYKKFNPILGWSVSRYDIFKACKRQYFYNYYGKYDAENSFDRISTLKGMTSVALETGNIVHDVMKTFLERVKKSSKPIGVKNFLGYASKLAFDYCDSKLFSEVYYNELPSVNVDEISAKVDTMLKNFLDSERFVWIMEKASYGHNQWVIEPEGYGETVIDGLKAYCKVDFLLKYDNSIFILDWKTGKKDDTKHKKQMTGYAAWASREFSVEFANIETVVAYLNPSFEEVSIKVDNNRFEDFAEMVKIQTADMYKYCSNIDENIPIEKDKFVMTENKNICRFCNFRELCSR